MTLGMPLGGGDARCPSRALGGHTRLSKLPKLRASGPLAMRAAAAELYSVQHDHYRGTHLTGAYAGAEGECRLRGLRARASVRVCARTEFPSSLVLFPS